MRVKVVLRATAALMAMLVAVLLGASEIQSQQSRNRRSRRITNPVRRSSTTTPPAAAATASPTPATRAQTDATIVSTAGEPTPEDTGAAEPRRTPSSRRRTRAQTTQAEDEQQQLRSTVNRLSDQVTKLSEDLTSMKDQQRTLVDLERLSRAEQRAEGFRAQLREVMEKELGLQARLEQIEYDIQPDAIERRAALTGTLRPAELREQIRRQFESERNRVQQQLNLLTTSRARLETAVANADLEVERLRTRLDEADRRAAEAGTTSTPATDTQTTPATEPPTQGEPPDNER